MFTTVIKKLAKSTSLLFLIILTGYPQLNINASDLTDSTTSYSAYPVDYRHMALYELKLNRYHYPSSSRNPDNLRVEHIHSHNHLGWWNIPLFIGGADNREHSFTERVSTGLVGVAVVTTVAVITAATLYSASHVLWPYIGAASLTAIELPENSPWKITGYKAAHGGPIRYADLAFNEDAVMNARESEMFDRHKNPYGRFLLIDQENWWGVIDYPVDIDVTFTRFDPFSGEANEQITVNFRRSITNGLKAGTLSSNVIHATQNQQHYQLTTKAEYPSLVEFSNWYHKPSKLMVDFRKAQ